MDNQQEEVIFNMKKTTIVFVVAICLGLLFSGYASALDFDNVKSYDEDLKIIIITNEIKCLKLNFFFNKSANFIKA